jgi:HAD superfamily hydrolase (TIGR01484 family)
MASYPFKIVCTDFDGTLVSTDPWNRPPDAFFSSIQRLREDGGLWLINTGRDWNSLRVELTARDFPLWPDWVALVEREIHAVKDRDVEPWTEWNDACASRHHKLFIEKAPLLDRLYETLREQVRVSFQFHSDPGSPLAIIAHDEAEADRTHEIINRLLQQEPGLSVVRNSIYFRFSHPEYNKGACLGALTKRLGLSAMEVFAAGDHWNDIPMLQKSLARGIACPRNSIRVVKESVQSQGGVVTDADAGEGLVLALEHFESLMQG